MRVNLFDFDLPPERIALRPACPRDAARLLIIRPHGAPRFEDRAVFDLPDQLAPGDVLAVNDTRVIRGALHGVRVRGETSARITATLMRREGEASWRAFVRPAKKLQRGEVIRFAAANSMESCAATLDAEVVSKGGEGDVLLKFFVSGVALGEAIERIGHMPLPPYISSRRRTDEQDTQDYQTLFAQKPGAVAAPTASLHFTPRLAAALAARGVLIQRVTLHVGPGTFLPVKVKDTVDHKMHAEWGEVSQAAADAFNRARDFRWADHCRGDDELADSRSRGRAGWKNRGVRRRNVDLHHAWLQAQGGRCAVDQFPSAAFDPFHACRRLCRP